MPRALRRALSLSPMLGIIPAVNVRFDGDVALGNDAFGVTVICDELLWLAGVGTAPNPIPIPFLIDPMARYFEHLCVNVRCAGFGINFDFERPFPLPNPLLVLPHPVSESRRSMRLTAADNPGLSVFLTHAGDNEKAAIRRISRAAASFALARRCCSSNVPVGKLYSRPKYRRSELINPLSYQEWHGDCTGIW
jgi:hypothetical protein